MFGGLRIRSEGWVDRSWEEWKARLPRVGCCVKPGGTELLGGSSLRKGTFTVGEHAPWSWCKLIQGTTADGHDWPMSPTFMGWERCKVPKLLKQNLHSARD